MADAVSYNWVSARAHGRRHASMVGFKKNGRVYTIKLGVEMQHMSDLRMNLELSVWSRLRTKYHFMNFPRSVFF